MERDTDLGKRGSHLQGGRMTLVRTVPWRFGLWIGMESLPKEGHPKVRGNGGSGEFMPRKGENDPQQKEKNKVIREH